MSRPKGSKNKPKVEETMSIKETPNEKAILVKIDQTTGEAIIPESLLMQDGRNIRLTTASGAVLEPRMPSLQDPITQPPVPLTTLYGTACANDTVTIESWRDIWTSNAQKNSETYDFANNGVMEVFGKAGTKPVIIAGSGPSLKKNVHHLKEKHDIPIVSCLHNFAYFEDQGVMTKDDYYLTLDAGDITIKEVYEGGKHDPDYYWERTKDRTLCAFISSPPELIKKWRGRVLWFTTPTPDLAMQQALTSLAPVEKVPIFNVGGNALGACLYMAKAILGAGSIVFIGADFAFDHSRKFHAWDSPYDEMFKGVIPAIDIFGNRIYTWKSYYNFKCWFDYQACGGRGGNPTSYYNCTEGGILGAYPEGNLIQYKFMDLKTCLYQFNMYKTLPKTFGGQNQVPGVLF